MRSAVAKAAKNDKVKELLIDVIKWGIILLIGAAVLYAVIPKYEIMWNQYKFNKVTGEMSDIERNFKK